MLDKNKVEEAKANVANYLRERLLSKQGFNELAYNTLISNSKESIETANFLAKNNKSSLWIIVSSYYSMFYIANAVLCKLGYKVGDKISHQITSDALIVYVKDKLKQSLLEDYEEIKEEALLLAKNKAEGIIENFDRERDKRGFIQYKTTEPTKVSKAETSLKRAKEFIFEMEKLLSGLRV